MAWQQYSNGTTTRSNMEISVLFILDKSFFYEVIVEPLRKMWSNKRTPKADGYVHRMAEGLSRSVSFDDLRGLVYVKSLI